MPEHDPPRRVLPDGARVRVATLDFEGLTGRDPHPTEAEVGRLGAVVGRRVYSLDGPGQELAVPADGEALPDDVLIVYAVDLDGGGRFDFAEYEVEAVAPA